MRITLLTLSLLMASLSSQAKTMVISDIDDTLKVSHVRSLLDAGLNAFKYRNEFTGSSEVFQLLAQEIEGISFTYVSNAPSFGMTTSHTLFVRENDFPAGALYLRDEYSSDEYKVKTIRTLIKKNSPDKVILLGDNGESDINFYDTIVKEFTGQVDFKQYIHQVYEGSDVLSLKGEQVGYLTTLDILSDLYEDTLFSLSPTAIENLAETLAQQIAKEKRDDDSLTFPEWLSCESANFDNNLSFNSQVSKAIKRIKKVCLNQWWNFFN